MKFFLSLCLLNFTYGYSMFQVAEYSVFCPDINRQYTWLAMTGNKIIRKDLSEKARRIINAGEACIYNDVVYPTALFKVTFKSQIINHTQTTIKSFKSLLHTRVKQEGGLEKRLYKTEDEMILLFNNNEYDNTISLNNFRQVSVIFILRKKPTIGRTLLSLEELKKYTEELEEQAKK